MTQVGLCPCLSSSFEMDKFKAQVRIVSLTDNVLGGRRDGEGKKGVLPFDIFNIASLSFYSLFRQRNVDLDI